MKTCGMATAVSPHSYITPHRGPCDAHLVLTHMSDANVVRFLSNTSGAANPLVYPTVEDTTIVLCVNPSDSRLKPQSVIFGCPSLSNNTLLGFKSPCTMDNPCRYATPWSQNTDQVPLTHTHQPGIVWIHVLATQQTKWWLHV